MRVFLLIVFLFASNLFSHTCVFDGKKMNSLGVSEIIKQETLTLYRCSDGHQMWLPDVEVKVSPSAPKKFTASNDVDFITGNISASKSSNSINKNVSKTILKNQIGSQSSGAVTKTEKMLKRDSFELNYSNTLNIKKFGLETLLHKKMESDKLFARELEDEKSELLHMMYTQKRLFDSANESKISIKKLNIFKNPKIFYVCLSILLTSYTVF